MIFMQINFIMNEVIVQTIVSAFFLLIVHGYLIVFVLSHNYLNLMTLINGRRRQKRFQNQCFIANALSDIITRTHTDTERERGGGRWHAIMFMLTLLF